MAVYHLSRTILLNNRTPGFAGGFRLQKSLKVISVRLRGDTGARGAGFPERRLSPEEVCNETDHPNYHLRFIQLRGALDCFAALYALRQLVWMRQAPTQRGCGAYDLGLQRPPLPWNAEALRFLLSPYLSYNISIISWMERYPTVPLLHDNDAAL